MVTLISNDMFRTIAAVGSPKKGDYFIVNYMKVTNMDDYLAYEKKVWLPFAEKLARMAPEPAGRLTSGYSPPVQIRFSKP